MPPRIRTASAGVSEFDAALFGHIGFAISNAARSLVMGLTLARFTRVPDTGRTRAATSSTSTASAPRSHWPRTSPCWRSAAI